MLINKNKNPHGGDIYSRRVEIDFSSNINSAGMPKRVRDAIVASADSCDVYPDPYCTELRAAISKYENVPRETIICGNGAAELIYSFAYSLPKEKPALIVSPTFSEYETALGAAGVRAEHYALRQSDGFRLTRDIMNVDLCNYSAVFVCSPNNPTGITVESSLITSLAKTGARLFLDLCFLDLTGEPERYDIPNLIKTYPNVVVLRAFTKNFAVAGLRVGYALCSDAALIEKMSEKAPCWNVSTVAQRAGVVAAECGDWLKESVKSIISERERMKKELCALGVTVYDGEANYLLLYSKKDLCNLLLARGILVRDCSNYIGLEKGHVRIAIRKKADDDILLKAIKEVMK